MTARLISGTFSDEDLRAPFGLGIYVFIVMNDDGTTDTVPIAVSEVWMPYTQPVGNMFKGESLEGSVEGHFDPAHATGYFATTP